jgi:hypothetical protein
VGYGIQKRVLAFVAADLADQKDSIEDNTSDQDREKKDSEHIKGNAAAVDVHPSNIQRHGKCREANP